MRLFRGLHLYLLRYSVLAMAATPVIFFLLGVIVSLVRPPRARLIDSK
jgi:hypothetical protein